LGVQGWLAAVPPDADASDSALRESRPALQLYRQGAMVAASNPKAILFAAAFFPQFLNPGAAKLPQFSILLATFAVIEVSWYLIYAMSGHKLSHYLRQARVMRNFNRVTGVVFVGFAALMVMVHD
jgi:threonine/homoserine/homoserine lactone efflux protein